MTTAPNPTHCCICGREYHLRNRHYGNFTCRACATESETTATVELPPRAAAYGNARLVAGSLLDDLRRQLALAPPPTDPVLRWRHVHAMNRLNATLSEAVEAIDQLNNRSNR